MSSTRPLISTVNYHLLKACNFRCKFCYASFADLSQKGLSKDKQFELIEILANSQKFNKINFAGGEPTLVPHLPELIAFAKALGLQTSIVTNGSKCSLEYMEKIAPNLDILSLSLDSLNPQTNQLMGRADKNGWQVPIKRYLLLRDICTSYGIKLKINTVVSKFNQDEVLSPYIDVLAPFRWKILQVTKVEGQNHEQFEALAVSSSAFENFVKRNPLFNPDIKPIIESSEIINNSYLMIDFRGCFFDAAQGRHVYSEPILEAGLEQTLNQVSWDYDKFLKREGCYRV